MIAPARTLCLIPKSPLPPDTGSRQRIFHLLHALHDAGPIDLVVAEPLDDDERVALETAFSGARVWAPARPLRAHTHGRLRWLTVRTLPLGLAVLDLSGARREVAAFVDAAPAPYDLVFSYTAALSWMFGRVRRRVPMVCDMADIGWVVRARQVAVARAAPDARSWRGRKTIARLVLDQRRLARFEREEGARATLVTLCSEVDRQALGLPGTQIVSNGYARPARPSGRVEVGADPVLLFAGQMTYGPNEDGACWFAASVWPLVRSGFPTARLVILGRPTPAVEALAALEGVEVRGYVEDLEAELAAADLVVVPLRQGSGTRIKILEAWAHHLPVVATTVGAEGFDAIDGRDLLVADTEVEIAAAIARVLGEPDLRAALVRHGADRFDQEFDWAPIERRFAEQARAIAASASAFVPKVAR